jgi:tetratricopeptide (TPR) repeat protein
VRALLAAAIAVPVFALGGLHTPVLCITTALLGASAFIAWFYGSPTRPRLPATVLFVTGVGLTVFTLLQALPLPAGVVRVLAPSTAETWAGALDPLHEPGPSWTALSLDPSSTWVQVLRGVAYLLAFLAALRVCDRRGGTRFLSAVIVTTATGVAVAAMLHPMFGAQRVFGVYQPHDSIDPRHIAPLLNPNHLAAYLNIGVCLALGLALDRRRERLRPIAIAVVFFLGGVQVWIASRGGLLALGFGVACTFLMSRASRRFTLRAGAQLLLPGVIIAAGIAMIVIGASTDASNELNSTDTSKLKLALSGLALVRHHPIFGVGRGAFEVAFPAVQTQLGYVVASHPENLIVQWVTEWGVPVAVAAFAAVGFALRPKVLVMSSSPAIGAWSAIATTAVHNLVDFNSEVPAVGISVAVCAAMVVAGHGGERDGVLSRWGQWPRAVAVGFGVAAASCIAITLVGWPHELDGDRSALYERVAKPELPDDFTDAARAAMKRHPSEPYLPFISAVATSRRGRSVVPWIERTLTLAPIYGPAHFVLARQLARRSRAQALLEYRLAISQARGNVISTLAVENGGDLVESYDDALELLPEKYEQRVAVLESLAARLSSRLPATRERLDELYARLAPNAVAPLDRSVQDILADVQAGSAAPWCDGEYACVKQGLTIADRLRTLEPGSCDPLVEEARLLIASDRAPDGLHLLRTGAETATNPVACWRGLGELAFGAHNDTYLQVAEDEVSRTGCDVDADCANNLVWIAQLEQGRGNARRAIGFYQRAHAKAPERVDIVQTWAELASGLGMHSVAVEAYRELQLLSHDPKWQAAAERERSATMRDQMAPP